MFKRILASPASGAVGAILSALLGGLSWAGLGFPDNTDARLTWLAIWFGFFFATALWAFIAQHVRLRALHEHLVPKLLVRFDPSDTQDHVRLGRLANGTEYRYVLGITNLSTTTIHGVRVTVDRCLPEQPHAIYPGQALGDRTSGATLGMFDLKAGDRVRLDARVDVFQEFIEQNIGPAKLRLLYANQEFPQGPKWLTELCNYEITLRIDGNGLAQACYCKFKVEGDPERYRITMVEPD